MIVAQVGALATGGSSSSSWDWDDDYSSSSSSGSGDLGFLLGLLLGSHGGRISLLVIIDITGVSFSIKEIVPCFNSPAGYASL